MPRRVPTVLTMDDMKRICYGASPETYTKSGVISELRPKFTKKLRGKNFELFFDGGTVIKYQFGIDGLQWSENGGDWNEEYAECLESTAEGVFLVHHLRTHVNPYEAATLVLDTNTSLVTWVRDTLGNVNSNRDVNRKVVFGTIGNKVTGRHAKTDEVVGKVIDWKFADQVIIHCIYETVVCCAFVSPPPAKAPDWEDYFETFNPSKYVKIADGLYLITFYAPNLSGMEVTMLMDLNKMTAVGAAFGFDITDVLRSYTFGAKGAYATIGFVGRYTVE